MGVGKDSGEKYEDRRGYPLSSAATCYQLGVCGYYGGGWVTQEAFEDEVLVSIWILSQNFNLDKRDRKTESKSVYGEGAEKHLCTKLGCYGKAAAYLFTPQQIMKGSCLNSFYLSVTNANFCIPCAHRVWLESKHTISQLCEIDLLLDKCNQQWTCGVGKFNLLNARVAFWAVVSIAIPKVDSVCFSNNN